MASEEGAPVPVDSSTGVAGGLRYTLAAKADLEAAGLEVKQSGERWLWIAATTQDVGDGIRLSSDAAVLFQRDEYGVAIFPAGALTYEVPGALADSGRNLVDRIA